MHAHARRRRWPSTLATAALPFLRHTEVVVLPIGGLALLALVGIVVGFNPTRASATFFFATAEQLDLDEFDGG